METAGKKQNRIVLEELGLMAYQEAWAYQKQLFEQTLQMKKAGGNPENHLLFCEHPPVYTLGKSGNRKHLLINDEMLRARGAAFYPIDRGGDITFHGPGQLVGYPIFDLDTFPLSIKDFVYKIEEVMIRTIAHFGLTGSRIEKATGVWIDAGKPRARKITAIGMRIHRKVSMHGFAMNVNTDLDYFSYIIPCGITDKGVTSLQKELGHPVEMDEVKNLVISEFHSVFGWQLSK
jgi:lipoyl(octanoyl) transferase